MADLDELRRLIETDPGEAADRLARLAEQGAPHLRGPLIALLAEARLAQGEVRLASEAAVESVRLANVAGDVQAEAEALIVLASVESFDGTVVDAVAHLQRATAIGDDRVRLRAQLQQAAVLQRAGQMDEALQLYRRVLPAARRTGDQLNLARVLANVGIIEVRTGSVTSGVSHLGESLSLFEGLGHRFAVAQLTHNLGWAYGRLGEIKRGLALLDRAREQFDALGLPLEEATFDRAELLLDAGLWVEAAAAAHESVELLGAAGNRSARADALLLWAAAARLGGELELVGRLATEANGEFAALGHVRGAALCELATVSAAVELDDVVASVAQAEDLEARLRGMGMLASAAEASALVAVLAARSGDGARASAAAQRCRSSSMELRTLDARLHSARASAHAALVAGSPGRARRAVMDGFEHLLRQQARVGSAHDRAQLAQHAGSLGKLLLSVSVRERDPRRVLEAVEVARSSALLRRSGANPLSGAARDLVARLRVVGGELRSSELGGERPTHLVREQRRLESKLRTLALAGDASTDAEAEIDLDAVDARLMGRRLVEVAVVDGHAVAVVLSAGREPQFVELGDTSLILQAASGATRSLTALTRCSPGSRRGHVQRLRQGLSRLDQVVGPLGDGADGVVLVMPPSWTSFPWALLPSWRGRPVVVAPSARWWVRHDRTDPVGDRALVVAGPRIRSGLHEATAVASVYPTARVLTGAEATSAAVIDEMSAVDVAHLAAHGHMRADNPFWSSLELADGPLLVFDIEALGQTPPLVVLSSCDTFGSGSHSGEELLGFGAALLSSGTRTLVGAIGPLPDSTMTAQVMTDLHQRLRRGVLAGRALAEITASEIVAIESGEEVAPVSCQLLCIGCG